MKKKLMKRSAAFATAFLMSAGIAVSGFPDGMSFGIAAAAAGEGVEIESCFPNANFRNLIKTYDTDDNGFLDDTELSEIKSLYVNGKDGNDISSFKGIEYLTELNTLQIYYCSVTSIDLSKNTKLIQLYALNNHELTSLDISSCKNLYTINVANNDLEYLDLSSKPILDSVHIARNRISEVKLEGSTAITSFQCYRNRLTKLDLSQCTSLDYVSCDSNNLTGEGSLLLPDTEIPNLHIGPQGEYTEYSFSGDKVLKLGLPEDTYSASDWWYDVCFDDLSSNIYAYGEWYPFIDFVGELTVGQMIDRYNRIEIDFNTDGITEDMYAAVAIATESGSDAVLSDYVLLKNGHNVIGTTNFKKAFSVIADRDDKVTGIYLTLNSYNPEDINVKSYEKQFNDSAEPYYFYGIPDEGMDIKTGDWWIDENTKRYWTGIAAFGDIWSSNEIILSDIADNHSAILTELYVSELKGDAYAYIKLLTNTNQIIIGDIVKLKNGKNIIGGSTSAIWEYDGERTKELYFCGDKAYQIQISIYSDDSSVSFKATNKLVEDDDSNSVMEMIDAIGTVEYTAECAELIEAAREAYDALTDEQKELVTNYETLTSAEEKYAELKAEAEKNAEDVKAANGVIDKIASIGEVSFTAACAEKIEAAREAYDSLTDEQKELVTNYETLTAAEEKYTELKAEAEKNEEDAKAAAAVIEMIEAIGSPVTADSAEQIIEARKAYEALTDVQKALVTNIEKLAEAEMALVLIKEDAGDISDITDPESNAANADINISKVEIIEIIDLTPEEMSAVLEGADVTVKLESTDITETVSEEDKKAVEEAVSSDTYIALYLDLDMYKIIDTHNGEPTTTELHQLNGNVTVKIKIPESFINKNTAINREYYVVHVDSVTGATTKIACGYNILTGEAEFETDGFSTYALVYEDKPVNSHEHSFGTEWEYDSDAHWHKCDCGEMSDKAEHTFGEWKITGNATAETDGKKVRSCTICGYSEEETVKYEGIVYYGIVTSGNVYADRNSAAAGQTVNVRTDLGYDIIVTAANGRQIAKITEKGSFTMPASTVYVTAVQNETFVLMANAWNNSYVFSYDADMNRIKVSSTKKRGVIVIDLGEDYAGKSFVIYSGRKSSKVKVTDGRLDAKGKFTFEVPDGQNYTLVVED